MSAFLPRGWRRREVLGLLALGGALLSAGPYLGAAARLYRPGFPLDDAWIYQTFARTWAFSGTWGPRPGQPAAGATAPLWVVPLAVMHRLVPHGGVVGAWVLGVALLAGMALLVWKEARRAGLNPAAAAALAGLFLTEWHLVWASLSGMETLAFAFLAWRTLRCLDRDRPAWARLGWSIGAGVWLRPEAVLLLLPWAWRVGWLPRRRERIRAMLYTAFPLLVLLVLYVAVQLLLTGRPWPNTAQAKVVEYAALQARPFPLRWAWMALPPLVGPSLLLLPWVGMALRRHRRAWGDLLWVLALVTVYAWRLPAAYQHGRYVMPVIPALLWWGGLGFLQWRPGTTSPKWSWRVLTFWRWLAALWVLGFWALGLRAFARDVAFIESTLVDTARWVAVHLPPEKPVAVHDIGAMGYFAPQPLVDLAGLVNPEVVPFMRDVEGLSAYLRQKRVEYLVVFEGWYDARLTSCATPLHRARPRGYPPEETPDLVVYRWRPCP